MPVKPIVRACVRFFFHACMRVCKLSSRSNTVTQVTPLTYPVGLCLKYFVLNVRAMCLTHLNILEVSTD